MNTQQTPAEILEAIYQEVANHLATPCVGNSDVVKKIEYVIRSGTKAGQRFLLASSLAKLHDPQIDIRKPYTELGPGSYSGRTFDETYVIEFINTYDLPCNSTTAFLTPAFRAKNIILEPGIDLGGTPKRLYEYVISLINVVHDGELTAQELLCETVRQLLLLRRQQQQRMHSLLDELSVTEGTIPLSSEDIVNLISQHLALPRSSRLPVLVVAAAYQAASDYVGERALPLEAHNAADEQTGALGDVEITLVNEDEVVTSYEMKMKRVTKEDIERALQKVRGAKVRIDNYIFITTDEIDPDVADFAETLYRKTGGIEFAILDCISFVRHFLHLFHRLRIEFLDAYQVFVLNEPQSAMRQELKEAFLALRRAAESSYSDEGIEDSE